MKWSWWLCVSICSLALSACGPKFEGYTEVAPDVHLRLVTLGDKGLFASEADFVLFRFSLETQGGQTVQDGVQWLHKPDSTAFGSVELGRELLRLHPGDSLHLMVQGRHLAGGIWDTGGRLSDTSIVRLRICFVDHATSDEFAARYRSFWLEPAEEDLLLADYLAKNTTQEFKFRGGIYFRKIITGLGDTLRVGDEVLLGCRGTFLNGQVFDDTYKGRHLWFTYGRPDQLIGGLQKAVWSACKGDSIEAIIPSYLAFGPKGSSSGIVPPYTPVRYRFRIIDVRTADELAVSKPN